MDEQLAELAQNRASLVTELDEARTRAEEVRAELAAAQPMDTDEAAEGPKYTEMPRPTLEATIVQMEGEYKAALDRNDTELAVTKISELQLAALAPAAAWRKRPVEAPACCMACGFSHAPGATCGPPDPSSIGATQPATESQIAAMAPTQRT